MYKIIGADGKEYGPASVEQIRQWLHEGRANFQSKVRLENQTEWQALGALPEFAADRAAIATSPPPIPPAGDGGVLSKIVPYRNGQALAAYYLAIFSLIPCVGLLLGLAGFILGILGLRAAGRNPAIGGKVHAWIGIVLGGLCGFGNLVAALVFFSFRARGN